jgi:hypothetical protein
MLLLSSGTFKREIIEVGRLTAVFAPFDRRGLIGLTKAPVMMDHDRSHPVFRGALGGHLQTRHGDNAKPGTFVLRPSFLVATA